MRIKADSLRSDGEISSKDRREMERMMNEEVLEASKYPEIVYESAGSSGKPVGRRAVPGRSGRETYLHGVTREPAVAAQMTSPDDMLRANRASSLFSKPTTGSSWFR